MAAFSSGHGPLSTARTTLQIYFSTVNPPYLAWIAIFISLVSLGVSIFNARRDRAKLRANSRFVISWEGFDATIYIEIVNAGRRAIILDTLVSAETCPSMLFKRKTLHWSGEYFDHPAGLSLGERQAHRVEIRIADLIHQTGDDVFEADEMWVEDTLGYKHKIKGIRKNITKLMDWDNSQCRPSTPPAQSVMMK